MPEIGITIETLPVGSEAVDIASSVSGVSLDAASLNGLANGVASTSFSFSNPSGASLAKVVIFLNVMDPSAVSPVVSITNGTSQYDLPVPSANSAKQLEWNSIPVAFLSSFTVINSTGVAFPSSGNSIHILPL